MCIRDSVTCGGNDTFIDSNYIITYNKNKRLVSVSGTDCYWSAYSGYNMTKPGYILLPKNISTLNDYMCGPLNRKGFLCGECSDGFGPSMVLTACTDKCYNCSEAWHGMTLYLFLELVPITVFYLFVLTFRVSVTSAPMTCFIMYSQLIIITSSFSWCEPLLRQVQFTKAGDLKSVSKVIFTLYGVFNLAFFRYIVPPFCISRHLKSIHVAWLGYVSAFYPILLIVLTWVCVELHGHDFRLVVRLWEPFHRCFVRLRRGWDTRSDLIDVFASFFLLSYSKIMYQTLIMLNNYEIYDFSLVDDHISNSYVLGADVRIVLGSAEYVVTAVILGLIFCLFNLLPIVLLVFYPYKIFRMVLSKCKLDGIALNTFVEKFQHCYRDGLDGGRDMRSFSGLYFLLIIVLFVVVLINRALSLSFKPWFLQGTIFLFSALLVALCRPYKKTYMNVLDTLSLSHLATLCHLVLSDSESNFIWCFIQILILIPFFIFILLITFKLVICRLSFLKSPLLLLTHLRVARTDVGITAQQQQQRQIQPLATYGTMH